MSYSLSSRHFYRSLYLSLNNVFQKAVPKPDVTNPVSLSSCLRLIPCLPVISIVPSYLSLNNVFYKAIPTADVTNPVSLPSFYACRIFLSSLTLLTLLHFSHHRPNWSSSSLSSTTLRNFPGNSDLLREDSMFQQHTKLYSKFSTFTGFFLKFKSTLLVKIFILLLEQLLVPWQFAV